MRWSDLPRNPTDRTVRQFAGLWTMFFSGLAAWEYFAHQRHAAAGVLLALALTMGPLGLAFPRLLRPIYVLWMIAVFPIGWLVSHVLLAALFYGLFTPVGLLFRLLRRDALSLSRPVTDTYWRVKPAPRNVRSYFRQF